MKLTVVADELERSKIRFVRGVLGKAYKEQQYIPMQVNITSFTKLRASPATSCGTEASFRIWGTKARTIISSPTRINPKRMPYFR